MIHLALWIVSLLIVCAVVSAIFSGLGEAISLPFIFLYNSIPKKYRDLLDAYKLIIYLTVLIVLVLFIVLKESHSTLKTENITTQISDPNETEAKALSKTNVEAKYKNPWIVSTINTSEKELLLIVSLDSDKESPSLKEKPEMVISDIKPFLCNGALREVDMETIEVSISFYRSTKKIKNITLPKSYCSQT